MNDETMRAQMALDGELDAAHLRAFEADLRANPALAAEYARLAELRETIRAHVPREAAPEALRARIEAMAGGRPRTAAATGSAASRGALSGWRYGGLAAALVVAAALAGYQAGRAGGDPALDTLVASAQRAALSGQPIDVASSDRHTVKPWLAARAPLGARVIDLTTEGYPLIGGRIDVVGGRPVPTLVYRRREHLISVTELPLQATGDGAAAREGYHVERWRDGERAYVAVSDIDAADLAAFSTLFQKTTGRE